MKSVFFIFLSFLVLGLSSCASRGGALVNLKKVDNERVMFLKDSLVSSWTEEQIEKTLEQANKELPNHFLIIKELSTKIFNDSDSCERANLNYVNPNYKLIKTGITHYLLSNANQNAT